MAKKNKDSQTPDWDKPNYSLNRKAVDELVEANEENTPEYSPEELKKYHKKGGFDIPDWSKAILIKIWFAGAVCFFFIWGLALYIPNQLDLFVVTALAMGFVTDILENNVLRFIAVTPGANDKWMMFPKKKYFYLFLNVLYSFVLMVCVFVFYNMINIGLVQLAGVKDTVPFGVEPVTFGVFYFGFDMLFLGIKRLCGSIVKDAKAKVKKGV